MTYDLNKLNNFLKKDAPHTPPTTSPDNNSSINTTSGVLSIPLNTSGDNF
jgi:hypothetical protein